MTYAIVPAAGRSTRMGQPKLSLSLGGRTVLERVVEALRSGGCEHVLVLVGPQVTELEPLAAAAGAHTHVLAHSTPDMRTTVEIGLRCLEEQFHPRSTDAWFLAPADHPTLDARVIERLLAEYERVQPAIVVPTYQCRRGHPALIAWRLVAGIRTFAAGQGLNAYLRAHANETLEVAVDEESVVLDMDTPADLERLRALYPA